MNRHFQPFALERLLSQWEDRVEYTLSESGVYPVSLRELVTDPLVLEQLLSTRAGRCSAQSSRRCISGILAWWVLEASLLAFLTARI